jgi:hypothetical protein
VAVSAVGAAILVAVGNVPYAVALVVVAASGLIAFLRTTHPRGDHKPDLGIFFDEATTRPPVGDPPRRTPRPPVAAPAPPSPAPAPAPSAAPTAPAPPGAEVIDLRQTARRDPAVAAAPAAPEAVAAVDENPRAAEVSDELANHHVRLLRQVQVKLQDYE